MSDQTLMTEIMDRLVKLTDPADLAKIQDTAYNRKRDLKRSNAAVETATWEVGNEVQIIPEQRHRKPWQAVGKIKKINRVNMVVDFGNGMVYNVPKTMLVRAE